jgi:23S rRNA G2069 N7-methylase RlmK/C1962 C5-methylase RlmI
LPFENESFSLVIFDPPHLLRAGRSSWLAKKYGVLDDTWQVDIAIGFKEAMRLLKPNGVLVFKWNDDQIKLSEVLKCIDYEPLFGDKRSKTHWLFFMKESKR